MIYSEKYETLSHDDLEQVRIERLQSTLNRVYRNVAFYNNTFDASDINIEDIKTVDDISRLPFTTKEDLRKSYPYDMFAVPLRDIVRIHSTVGRTGKPIAIGFTKNDIANWSTLVARLLAAVGISDHDFLQIAFDYSMFTGAFGLHYGAEKLGASVIPSSSTNNIQKQIMIMKDYKTTVMVSTPSYAMRIARNLKEMGIHPEELNLNIGLFGSEPWNDDVRKEIEEKLHISAYNCYGINEMMGPGVSGECLEKQGLHINEDHFIVEIIDPDTLKPVPSGKEGELVITTITREGFPLIRYRTGDMSSLIEGSCPCGRTTARMSRVSSRFDDLIVINGMNVFPSRIDEIIKTPGGTLPRYQAIVENMNGVDTMEIQVEMEENMFDDEMKKLVDLKNGIGETIKGELGVTVKVSLVEQDTLQKDDDGNVNKIIDKR